MDRLISRWFAALVALMLVVPLWPDLAAAQVGLFDDGSAIFEAVWSELSGSDLAELEVQFNAIYADEGVIADPTIFDEFLHEVGQQLGAVRARAWETGQSSAVLQVDTPSGQLVAYVTSSGITVRQGAQLTVLLPHGSIQLPLPGVIPGHQAAAGINTAGAHYGVPADATALYGDAACTEGWVPPTASAPYGLFTGPSAGCVSDCRDARWWSLDTLSNVTFGVPAKALVGLVAARSLADVTQILGGAGAGSTIPPAPLITGKGQLVVDANLVNQAVYRRLLAKQTARTLGRAVAFTLVAITVYDYVDYVYNSAECPRCEVRDQQYILPTVDACLDADCLCGRSSSGENGAEDHDGDGFTVDEGDCDDENAAVRPGRAEVCFDSVDNDCDGAADCDDPACAEACEGGSNGVPSPEDEVPPGAPPFNWDGFEEPGSPPGTTAATGVCDTMQDCTHCGTTACVGYARCAVDACTDANPGDGVNAGSCNYTCN